MGYEIRTDYENNGFTQAQHDALSHMNIAGVKDNVVSLSKTNFKLDSVSLATANSMGALVVDVLNDASGINSGASSGYTWRGSPNYDVVVTSGGPATVISNAYSESSVPAEAIVTADETLGTGSITYYVSRDNGTTWTSCAKDTVTNISAQPSGVQLKWKAVITGNAELNAIAVAV